MLDKVLTLSALENYKIDFFMEPVDIEKIITDACEHLEVRIKQQGLNLHRALEKQYITGDKERLNQIFLNLIDNAIKYNRENGHIWVSVKREYNEVCVQIQDTGIGIPSEAREKLFTPFFTVDKAHPQSTGLGLALVKELTEKQGGTIKLLEGTDATTFEVRFPCYNCLQV
jgi:signal transduction histidine kinase